ncbi:hypothetical protein DUNSADRAFT_15020 [Dunaliella salina]|uniref:Encoded protein n=1 Tax=Dunaliella salina TaxID=3046 RepID=A0ABQ7G689_DUNSA|nr:hypothetical protein DUNSADRAFT_15020 [Dunaliella salina]|eukprot:KAF5830129.1 hypothetical protein DUNSADRAFT_15020 [Dunaliella salina]
MEKGSACSFHPAAVLTHADFRADLIDATKTDDECSMCSGLVFPLYFHGLLCIEKNAVCVLIKNKKVLLLVALSFSLYAELSGLIMALSLCCTLKMDTRKRPMQGSTDESFWSVTWYALFSVLSLCTISAQVPVNLCTVLYVLYF